MTDDPRPPHGRVRWKAFAAAVVFCAGLLIFERIVFSLTFHNIAGHIAEGNYARLVLVILLSLASIAASVMVYYVAFSSSVAIRIVCWLIFFILTAGQYAYFRAFGRFVNVEDLFVAAFVGDRRFIFDSAIEYFEPISLIPIGVFTALQFITFQGRVVTAKAAAAAGVLVILLFAASGYSTRNEYYTVSTSAGLRAAIDLPVKWFVGSSQGSSRLIPFYSVREHVPQITHEKPTNNIVLIVDESVRADRLSINGYAKPLTPKMQQLADRGMITNWGTAVAGTTCSVTSNSLLLTGVTELPDRDFQVYKWPTIFQYAKAMNYRTTYIDGQTNTLWNGKPSDAEFFDEWIKASELKQSVGNPYDIDIEIARRVRSVLESSTGNFIWVTKYGVHKPYVSSYPNEESGALDNYIYKYNPEIDRETLARQYDNAVEYNSRIFFENLIPDAPPESTYYLYTSDHGQTLAENGATASHCVNSQSAASVPLFIITKPGMLTGVDSGYAAAHSNIFASLLDLMNVSDAARQKSYGPSLLKARSEQSRPRIYFSGDLAGQIDGKVYPFDP